MTATQTRQPADVPLPAGASAAADSWETWDNECRIIHGAIASCASVDISVSAVQLPDGTIVSGDGPDEPRVHVAAAPEHMGWTRVRAREVAAALIEAADMLDRWAVAMSTATVPRDGSDQWACMGETTTQHNTSYRLVNEGAMR